MVQDLGVVPPSPGYNIVPDTTSLIKWEVPTSWDLLATNLA